MLEAAGKQRPSDRGQNRQVVQATGKLRECHLTPCATTEFFWLSVIDQLGKREQKPGRPVSSPAQDLESSLRA